MSPQLYPHRTLTCAGFVLLALCLLTSIGYGQAISGDLVGTVVDKSGAVVPNATVEATNVATNVKSTSRTNNSGEYRIPNLLPGTYTVTATAQGFGTTGIRIPVELNKTATANLTMGVGQVATTVEVTGTSMAIDTTTAQLQTTYETKQAQDVPTASVGLGVLNLSLLSSGVASTGGLGAGTGPSVSGQRPRNNNFNVEGVDNNDKGVTGPLIYVPSEAVSNFTVLQNQFSPEFGHSTGGQFNTVVTSGTNAFHGRVYEYFQNRNLNAIDVSLQHQGLTSNPRFDNNRFGGQIGGPIVKNKLFFFFNGEYNPIGQTAATAATIVAPTAAGYAALAGVSGISTNNTNVLKQFATAPVACTTADVTAKVCPSTTLPVAGVAGGVQVGVLSVVPATFSNTKAYTTSIDYNLSDSDQIRGRYIYNHQDSTDFAATLPQFFSTIPQTWHLIALSEYHTFSPTLNNELRIGFNRTGFNFTVPNIKFPGLDAFPNLTIDNLGNAGLNVGPDPNAPQSSVQNLYQLVDNISWTHGNHTFKFGGEGRKYISPQLFIQRSRGDYEWGTLDAYLHDAVPDFAERSNGGVGYSGNQYAIYGFVNDTWKVRQDLSLNLGLRYEYTSTPFGWTQQSLNSLANVPGLITFGSPKAPKKDFAPRVGFAWSPGGSGNTSIRGGFGMGYDVLYDNIGVLSRPPQIGSTRDCPGASICPLSGFLANGAIPAGTGGTGLTTLSVDDARANTASFLPNDVKYPYSMQWNFGVQHAFGQQYSMEVRYVGTRGVHLNVQNRLNVQDIVTPSQFLPTFLSAPSQATLNSLTTTLSSLTDTLDNGGNIDPRFAAAGFTNPIVGFLPLGGSIYHGLQTQVNRRFNNGLQFQAAYTWSHTIDDSTADFFSTVLTPRRQQNFQNLGSDRSNSAIDRRHRLTFQAIYDLPFFKGSNAFLKNVVGNWEFSPIYTYESGEWADVQSAVDANLNGDNAGDRAIFNPNGTPGTSSDVTALKNAAGETVAYLAKDPNAQYIRAQKGALANSSRNTLQMDPINNIDFAVLKRLAFTERLHFEFGAQAFNLFNHPQFVAGSLNQVNSISRTDTGTKNYLTPGKSSFNRPDLTFKSNARAMQLSARFIF